MGIKIKKTAIVFGANGYIARNLVPVLLKENFVLNLFDLQNNSYDSWHSYSQLDITSKKDIEAIDFDVDFIFLFSALTGTKIGFDKYEDFIRTNEIGMLNIINKIKNSKSKARIIFPSTRLIYKGIKNTPLTEESLQEVKTIYAANKVFCEKIIQLYNELYNINYTIFRICVPYNNLIDSNYSYGTIGSFIAKASKGENITLYGNGNQKRTFTNIIDIINIMYESINNPNTINNIYNIGGETYSLKDVAELISKLYKVKVEYIDWPKIDLLIESGDTIFDSKKIDTLLEYKTYSRLEDWLKKIKV